MYHLANTRGNQRELARAKNMKKNNDKTKKATDDGLSAAARKQRYNLHKSDIVTNSNVVNNI
uniref:Small EDRK-rich factor-like N-terminal domain-containing protein n=1 Tax=Leptobrachium leishanense TaxID=445787 RepID=A0A8C5P9K0_9ANUR